ncbi:MAG TPA: chemotaxis protein CheX [Leptospiraceae bacterium]|nr:chemotaxis protein CheX [Leptospiraceae bacterium]HRG48481.1 chemotaxis protein CheX [Leptospiraceae bacterium]
MKEEELRIFIKGVMNYFTQFDGQQPAVGIPYPEQDNFIFLDYSGIIRISGEKKGCIYVTTSSAMLDELIKEMGLGEANESMRLDAIGEFANNIAGNAEIFFGRNFRISVPEVITTKEDNMNLPLNIPVFTIPFEWKSQKSYLVVGTPKRDA